MEKEYLITNGVNKSRVLEVEKDENTNEIALLGRALSQPTRIKILQLVNKKSLLLTDIAKELNIPISSAQFHMKALEEANLIRINYSTKGNGCLKYYSYGLPKTIVLLTREIERKVKNDQPEIIPIKIGDFIDANFDIECGFASDKEHYCEKNPNLMFQPKRHEAELIYSANSCYLTYAIPNSFAFKGDMKEINISLEICSEATGFNPDYPSDITFSINNKDLVTYTSSGDYGDRYGKFTPSWWYPESTKYGNLVNISVRKDGIYLNGKISNKNLTISDLNLKKGIKTLFKIQVKDDAIHKGGFNLFGEKFGEYNQPIVFTVLYE